MLCPFRNTISMNLIPGLTPAVTTKEHVESVGVHIVFVKHQEVWLHFTLSYFVSWFPNDIRLVSQMIPDLEKYH